MTSTDPTNPSIDDELHLEGEPAPELYEGRIWVDGCFDFFHHGIYSPSLIAINHTDGIRPRWRYRASPPIRR